MTSVTLKFSKCVVLAGLLTVAYSCSKSSTTSTPTLGSLSNSIAAVGVTSPTLHSSTSSAALFSPRSIWDFLKSKNFFISTKAYAATSTLLSFADFQTAFATRLASATVAEALNGFTLTAVNVPNANCYGPSVTVSNNPDSTGNPPGGDLGIWVSTNGTNNEACSAAQVNSLAQKLQEVSLQGLIVMAGVNLAESTKGTSTTTAKFAEGMASVAPTLIVTSASYQQLASVGGNPVYESIFTGTDASGNLISFTLKHSPTNSDNTTYTGILYGYMPQSSGNNNAVGFSLIYTKSSTTDITLLLKTGETANNIKNGSGLINTNGSFNFTGTGTGTFNQNGYRILSQINPVTNLGTMNLAWQAGSGDGNTRVFRANTSTDGTTTTGFSYFGFGDDIIATDGTDGSITKMICNWLDFSNHTGLPGEAQAQEMTFNSTTNVFNVATDHITYSNTHTCDLTAPQATTYTMSQWQGETSGTAEHTNPAGAVAITNNLVTNNTTVALGGVGVIPTITEPTVPF